MPESDAKAIAAHFRDRAGSKINYADETGRLSCGWCRDASYYSPSCPEHGPYVRLLQAEKTIASLVQRVKALESRDG